MHDPLELGSWNFQAFSERGDLVARVRQKLVQRRIEQPDRDGQSLHRFEDSFEIAPLNRQQLRQGATPACFVRCHDHLAHQCDAIALEEHVLGAAQPDAFRAELARALGVAWDIGVGAYAEAPARVGPRHQRVVILADLGRHKLDGAEEHPACRAVHSDHLPTFDGPPIHAKSTGRGLDIDLLRTDHARLPHPAGDDRRVARHAAASREHGSRGHNAVKVFR